MLFDPQSRTRRVTFHCSCGESISGMAESLIWGRACYEAQRHLRKHSIQRVQILAGSGRQDVYVYVPTQADPDLVYGDAVIDHLSGRLLGRRGDMGRACLKVARKYIRLRNRLVKSARLQAMGLDYMLETYMPRYGHDGSPEHQVSYTVMDKGRTQ